MLCFFKFCKTNEECEHLISLAKPSMVKSKVVDVKTGKSIDSRFCIIVLSFSPFKLSLERFERILNLQNPWLCRVRTSSGTFLKRGHDEIVEEIENRISDFTFIPIGMWLLFLIVQILVQVWIFRSEKRKC